MPRVLPAKCQIYLNLPHFSKHPYLAQTEPSTDDTSYIATMILVFNAAKYNSVMFSFFHDYTPKHYVYIYSLFPDLVPQLPQVTYF